MPFLYDLGITGYRLGIHLAAPFHSKARQWVKGRQHIGEELQEFPPKKSLRTWIHCASLGEFEQARPLMEALKAQNPEEAIVLTFFSPSGYEQQKHYDQALKVLYLPMDSHRNAKRFLEAIQPDRAIFVKYEFWYHYWAELKARNIPFYLISALFRQEQPFFQWYGGWARRMLHMPDHIFLRNQTSAERLASLGVTNYSVAGDTRYDRVWAIASAAPELPLIENFKGNHSLVVGGSTWPPEEELLSGLIAEKNDHRYVIAPHDVSESHLKQIEGQLERQVLRYSKADEGSVREARVLLIDSIGLLSSLYRYADLALVGGGFSGALHNILEPAAHGVPVLFGPNHGKFPEADALLREGGAFEIQDIVNLRERTKTLLNNPKAHQQASEQARKHVTERQGATQAVVNALL